MKNRILEYLIELFPNAQCELVYNRDYELLIATMLSAQTTDKRVNEVTKELFSAYSLKDISQCSITDLEKIIMPLGTYKRKAIYLKEIATRLLEDYKGTVPNNRRYIESLPGCGHKTCNVVLSNLFNENCIAVDTHVSRVAKRLNIANSTDDVLTIESKLKTFFDYKDLGDLHHRMVLFGRYYCMAKSPLCKNCKLKEYCNHYNKKS